MSDDPVAAPEVPAAPAPRRFGRGKQIATIVIALVIVGAGVGTAVGVSGSGGSGSNSPAGAVTALLTAVHNDDVVGMLAALDPGERDALQPGVTELVDQLKRLDVLSPNADLSKISGLDVSFSNVATSTHYLGSDLAAVRITGGTGHASVNLSELPLGSFITTLAGGALHSAHPTSSGGALASKTSFATVDIGGHWYVSLGYTIALGETKDAAPPAGGAVTAAGASSAAGAVRAMFQAVAGFNLKALIALTPPDEMAALHAYAPLFLNKAQSGLSHVASLAHVTFTSMNLATSSLGDATLVKVSDLGFAVTFDGIKLAYANGCVHFDSLTSTRKFCLTGAGSAQKTLKALPPAVRSLLAPLEAPRGRAALGFVTVDEGGQWFVSPTRTLLQNTDAALAVLRPSDLTAIEALINYLRANPTALKQFGSRYESGIISGLIGVPAKGSATYSADEKVVGTN